MHDPVAGDAMVSDGFWRFSLALYSRPGVAPALLRLQDRDGLDVNLILFALWFGLARGGQLTRAAIEVTEAATAGLRTQLVAPLRNLRRGIKEHADDDIRQLRAGVGKLELTAERRLQRRLALLAAPLPLPSGDDRLALARGNLDRYLGERATSSEAALVLRAAIALTRAAPGTDLGT
ncbi:MAG: TIGR02444 family protein [Alphaproteobacteria bacterium]|nr:TIGR02444 family protein [Alphaproteobacteria bacterium]